MKPIMGILIAVAGCAGLSACDVDQTKEGDLPEVEVNASGGQMPEFDVDAPDVNVGTTNVVVEVPTVDVDAAENDKQE